jgi:hypothetical protein
VTERTTPLRFDASTRRLRRIVTVGEALTGLGPLCGLAWAVGFRGLMADVAGADSGVEWYGTFVQVLLPGTVVAGLLGWAEHLRRTGGRRRWRWPAATRGSR